MDSEAYWAKRAEEREAAWQSKSRETLEKELAAYYEASLDHIQRNIDALYGRFAKDNALPMEEARKLLTGKEYRTWRMSLEEYVAQIDAGDKMLERELNTLAMRSRISRLDKLYSETLMELDGLGRKMRDRMDGFLGDAYKDNYYRGLYEIGHVGKALPAISQVDSNSVEAVLRTPWSGKNYSTRIWKNQKQLAQVIQDEVVASVHRGDDVRKISRRVADKMGVGLSNAQRLVRTELNYVHNQAALDSIRDAEMDYFRFVATLDSRTSEMCREHDGKIYPVDDADTGENIPPLHPRCRSIIVGSLGGRELKGQTRIAKGDEGKYIHVPAEMTYEDFQAVYVEKTQTVDEWNEAHRIDTSAKMSMPYSLPKSFIDERNPGKQITPEQLNAFSEAAKGANIQLGINGGDFGGFETYCGDVQVLYDLISRIKSTRNALKYKVKNDKIILEYRYIADSSRKINTRDFAESPKGSLIRLNKFFFDDSNFLNTEYQKCVSAGHFAKGSSHLCIIDHEIGHIITRYYYDKFGIELEDRVLKVCTSRAKQQNIDVDTYITNNISAYAAAVGELIPELLAKAFGKEPKLAKVILKEARIL